MIDSKHANSGQLFRPDWVSLAECMPHRIEQPAARTMYECSVIHLGPIPRLVFRFVRISVDAENNENGTKPIVYPFSGRKLRFQIYPD